jgi:hypothetical protein
MTLSIKKNNALIILSLGLGSLLNKRDKNRSLVNYIAKIMALLNMDANFLAIMINE